MFHQIWLKLAVGMYSLLKGFTLPQVFLVVLPIRITIGIYRANIDFVRCRQSAKRLDAHYVAETAI